MRYEKSCGAIVYRIIDNEIHYLILQSLEPDSYWGFAKGHTEPSETEEETCIREVFEETSSKDMLDKGDKFLKQSMEGYV